jgi:hypothetical protein
MSAYLLMVYSMTLQTAKDLHRRIIPSRRKDVPWVLGMIHKASPFTPNALLLWSLSTSKKRSSLAKFIIITLTEEQNSLTTGQQYKEECCRDEVKQLDDKVDSSKYFQYAVHNEVGKT